MVDTVSLTTALGAPVEVTTSAGTVTLEPGAQLVAITTGGTAGDEFVKLPNPTLTEDDWGNNQWVGRRITIFLKTQTNGSDIVKIKNDDDATTFNCYKAFLSNASASVSNLGSFTVEDIYLSYVGSGVNFVWNGYQWLLDEDATGLSFDRTPVVYNPTLQPQANPKATGSGSHLILAGGNVTNGANDSNAGSVAITGGNANGAGAGGNVEITPGFGNGAYARIKLAQLPSSDPGHAGQLYTNGALGAGTPRALMVSGG